ncbi:S8 family peptidase, partial [Microcoleus anatoxicus]|uniref:S8 family peptidase n=1 Tax=Microcoleus anatoxicus TaxID=2705319 RepID=UPI0030C9CC60
MTTPSRLPDDLKDTLATEQWWLFNNGQGVTNNTVRKGTPGIDINVLPLWPQYTGEGITVGVIDDGIDGNHKDFAGNFDASLSLPNNLGGPLPTGNKDNHGTAVAGIIAGKRNDLGTVGVAYNATIAGYKYAEDIDSLKLQEKVNVSNNSWGIKSAFDPQQDIFAAVKQAVTNGRGQLGTVFVWSAGNSRTEWNNQNLNLAPASRGSNANYQFRNSRFVINVAAIDNQGKFASYSSPGAPLLVSAFGDDAASVATVDRSGNDGYNTDETKNEENFGDSDYTNNFNGTSSATPMVSGIVALMLQANPKLGYRDVQEILAYSARKNDPDRLWQTFTNSRFKDEDGKDINSAVLYNADTWTFNGAKNWNGGGLHVNHDYGFGLVDATAAVRLAETWQLRSAGTTKNEAATAANEKS